MTNDFKTKQSSGARPPRLSSEEYAAKKRRRKKPFTKCSTILPQKWYSRRKNSKGISMCKAEWIDIQRTMYY